MKGMDLARAYCRRYASSLFEGMPFDLSRRSALGLVGPGSECLGFDDELSRDHDFGPGFCVWLEPGDYVLYGSELQCRYDDLPDEYLGLCRAPAPMGGRRVGVFDADEFCARYTGRSSAPSSLRDWLFIPQQLLAEFTSGEIFYDPSGVMARRRAPYLEGYPEQVVRKKVAAELAVMAQSGQYNLPRCMRRHDMVAANAARTEFLTALMAAVHLLSGTYMPFYKWSFRSLQERTAAPGPLVDGVRFLASCPIEQVPIDLIEELCVLMVQVVHRLGWARTDDPFALAVALEICRGITDAGLASLPVDAGSFR